MGLTTAQNWLLVILAAALFVFLLLGIVVLVKVFQVLGHVKKITASAEHVAGTVETVAGTVSKTAGGVAVLKLVANLVEHAARSRRKN